MRERGRLMQGAGVAAPGAMAAILALDADVVRDLCDRTPLPRPAACWSVDNDNCPGQIVISGEEVALDRGLALAKKPAPDGPSSLRSASPPTPAHGAAAESFAVAIAQKTPIRPPAAPVYANVSAPSLTAVGDIQQELEAQLTHPGPLARVHDGCRSPMVLKTFVEIGPKDNLTGLMKRIDAAKTAVTINNLETLQNFSNQTFLRVPLPSRRG
ncbi:MAG: ACP S-malonyltransferase [Chloroflexi bacterium]|nr:ACP S-malonyltransferase [Chloroflexota bacterium]